MSRVHRELTPGTISFPIFTTVCMQLMNSSIALPDMRTEYQIHGGGSGGSTTLSTSSSSETFIRSPRPYPQGSAYKEGHVIGNGAYGTVYKAHEIHDPDKIVALKKVRIPITEDGVPVSILREISLVRQLDHFEHPNIVRFLDVCTGPRIGAEHLLYLVFEYVDKDLAKFIQTASIEELSISKIQNITYQILTGIDFLHSQRIIHRDLKPHNLLISKAGIIKIADFGLAKIYDFTMRLTSVVVTLWYRSPEILLACSYGSPVDIWSIGCIFAELYRRRALFPGENERDQLNKIFDIIGTPSDQEWPNETPLLPSNFPYRPSKLLESQVPGLCSESLDLLKKLLLFNPKSRLDARTALKHPFFQSVISKTTLSVS